MLNEQIRQFIEDKHLKQSSIAHEMGMDPSKLNAIIKGRRKMDVEEFVRFCEVTNTDPKTLIYYKRLNRKNEQ